MKKTLLSLLVLLFTTSVFIACNQKGGSGEAYTLKMRLAKGDKFGHDMDMGMKMDLELMGQKMGMDMDIKGATLFEVMNSTDDLKELTMTYTKMKSTVIMKGDGSERDLTNETANNKIVGKKVTLKMNSKNDITDIVGVEDAFWGDSTDMTTREHMKKLFSKEQLNNMFSFMFQMYPDKPVRVGDSWDKEYAAGIAGIDMKMQATYTLKSVKDGVAYVDIEGKYKGSGAMDQGGMKFDIEMDGKQKGSINIGLADGYLKDSQVDMDIEAAVKMGAQKVPMKLKGHYLVKGTL